MIYFLFFLASFSPFNSHAVPSEGHQIMIAAPTPRAVEVGQKVARKGGNVVDVAVAVELTLAVTSPYYGSIGGGGFAMVRMNNDEPMALDFRETAPILTNPHFYKDKPEDASIFGGAAVGVPGISAGLWELHQKYGKLKWSHLFEEPIRLAEQGFPVSGEWVRLTTMVQKHFSPAGQRYFFKKTGGAYKPGEILKQLSLGKALRTLQAQGPKAFYEGEIGKDVTSTLKGLNGVMTSQDLKNYKVRWLPPVKKDYLGHTVYMMPPPSSSGVLTAGLIELVQLTNLAQYAPMSSQEYHVLAEILKIAFRGRSLLGDPDYNKNPVAMLTSHEYLEPLAKKISPNKTLKLAPLEDKPLGKESSETTNFTVMDSQGNTVVMTITLNGNYGSGVVTEKYGIALNNEMDDFTTNPDKPNMYGLTQGRANLVEAGKRPLSSMSPTIITKDNKTVMGVGASGGPRILTSVFQVWYRAITQKFDIDRAIQAPRVHHQFLPDQIFLDDKLFSPDTKAALEKIGHKVQPGWSGKVNGIILNDKGLLEGAYDSRAEGWSGGI